MPGDTELRQVHCCSCGAGAAAVAAEQESEQKDAEAVADGAGFKLSQLVPRGALSPAATVLVHAQAGLINRLKSLNTID